MNAGLAGVLRIFLKFCDFIQVCLGIGCINYQKIVRLQ